MRVSPTCFRLLLLLAPAFPLTPVFLPTPAAMADGYVITQVADGVHAALQPREGRFNDSNSAILINDRDVIVVDTQSSPAKVRELIAEVRELTNKPVRYVINTHWHGDHTQGNQVYLDAFPGVDIIGHTTLLEDIPQRAEVAHQEQLVLYENAIAAAEKSLETGKKADGAALTEEEKAALPGRLERGRQHYAGLQTVRFALPTVTVDDKLVLHRGSRRIEVLHFVAHTRGDLVVYLPEEKVLMTGDLLDELPYGGHGYPRSWIRTLETLEQLDFDRVITGHGRILEGKKHLANVLGMLKSVVAQTAAGAADGKTLEQLKELVDLSVFRQTLAGDDERSQRAFDGWRPELIERAFLEARGEIDD